MNEYDIYFISWSKKCIFHSWLHILEWICMISLVYIIGDVSRYSSYILSYIFWVRKSIGTIEKLSLCNYGFAITTVQYCFRSLYVIFNKTLRCFECLWVEQNSVVFQIWNHCPWSWSEESKQFSISCQFYYQKAPHDPIKQMNTHILCVRPLIAFENPKLVEESQRWKQRYSNYILHDM